MPAREALASAEVAPNNKAEKRWWLMGTGCGHDIISESSMTPEQREGVQISWDPIVFDTANDSRSRQTITDAYSSPRNVSLSGGTLLFEAFA